MSRIDAKRGESIQSLIERAVLAEDSYLRRRFLALYFIAAGDSDYRCYTAAENVGRCRAQVAKWMKKISDSSVKSEMSGQTTSGGHLACVIILF